jgi:hypothetical protein
MCKVRELICSLLEIATDIELLAGKKNPRGWEKKVWELLDSLQEESLCRTQENIGEMKT